MSEQAVNPQENASTEEQVVVRSLWIPLQEMAVLLPNTAVAEVTDYQVPETVEEGPEWLLGVMSWRGREVPLLSFERLLGLPMSEPGRRSRVAVLNTLSHDPQLPFIAFVAHGIPRLLQLHNGMLESEEMAADDDAAILARVSLNDNPALIPNMDVLEQRLSEIRISPL